MVKITLKAEKRKVTGRKVKNLRKEGQIPANIYGKDVPSLSIQVGAKDLEGVFKKAGETAIIDLTIGKEVRPVLVHNMQIHPVTDEVLHVDFRQVNLKEKVSANIPVELVGESPAQKSGIGTAVLLVKELEVEALPGDLPEKFEVDASILTEVDQVVKISDLKYDKSKVEVKTDVESIVAKVEPPQKEEVVVAAVVEEAAATTEGAEKPAEGTEAATPEAPKKEESKA
ncbi:MAG TPA: 50S ribosomal protein L25 [Candidatus Saccharimonadales bacterium]|nr:50S ribosomal protein L25 [Candidatus Saccharimonadales bacterium]